MIMKIGRIIAFLLSATAAAMLFAGLSAWSMSRLDPVEQGTVSLAYARRGPIGNASPTDASASESAQPQQANVTTGQPPIVAVFSGEFVDGAPVYRLPPIAVIADRKAALGRIEGQEDPARAN